MLTQDYEGREVDITITPWTNHISVMQAFSRTLKTPNNVNNENGKRIRKK